MSQSYRKNPRDSNNDHDKKYHYHCGCTCDPQCRCGYSGEIEPHCNAEKSNKETTESKSVEYQNIDLFDLRHNVLLMTMLKTQATTTRDYADSMSADAFICSITSVDKPSSTFSHSNGVHLAVNGEARLIYQLPSIHDANGKIVNDNHQDSSDRARFAAADCTTDQTSTGTATSSDIAFPQFNADPKAKAVLAINLSGDMLYAKPVPDQRTAGGYAVVSELIGGNLDALFGVSKAYFSKIGIR